MRDGRGRAGRRGPLYRRRADLAGPPQHIGNLDAQALAEKAAITRRADIETTVLLLVIGAAVTELAVWGRRQHAAASRRAGYLDGINAAARAAAAGESPGS